MPVGSMPYSAGSTIVTRIAPATTTAVSVARTSCRAVGSVSVVIVRSADLSVREESRYEIAGQLITDQDEAAGHDNDVGRERLPLECGRAAPEAHHDENRRERKQLAHFYSDVERHD